MQTPKVFTLLELCQHVVDLVAYGERPAKEKNADLAALARVSKQLSDPALDALWERLYPIGRLLKLLPDGAIGYSGTGLMSTWSALRLCFF